MTGLRSCGADVTQASDVPGMRPLDHCDAGVADAQRPLGRGVTGAVIDDDEFVDWRVLG